MKRMFVCMFVVGVVVALCATSAFAATKYVVTNDDNPTAGANSATVFSVGAGGKLTMVTSFPTGGTGLGGGFFATGRVNILKSATQNCAYVGDAWSAGGYGYYPGDVYAINMATLTGVGAFTANSLDNGGFYGISLAENAKGTFLFAAYTGSNTIATYAQGSDCSLTYKSEIITIGVNGVPVDGMRVTPNGKTLILGYSDGSIGAYKINPTTGALTLINRYLVTDSLPAGGVDITKDSKWALFGDAAASPTVEVAPINANGSLGPTVGYSGIGTGSNSNNVWLSPDETLVYVSDNSTGQIAAAPFNATTGVINTAASCTSPVLTGFGSTWYYLGSVATGSTAGTGSPLYAAEWGGGNPSGIGIVKVKAPCTLTEASGSPASDPDSLYLLTVGVDPPRKF